MQELGFGHEIFLSCGREETSRTIVWENDNIIHPCFKLKDKTNVLSIVSAVRKTTVF